MNRTIKQFYVMALLCLVVASCKKENQLQPADNSALSSKNLNAVDATGDDGNLLLGNPSGAAGVTLPNNYLMTKTYYTLSYSRDRGTHPSWTRDQVLQRMQQSARFYPNKDAKLGYGPIDVLKAVK